MSKRFTIQVEEDEYGDPLLYIPEEVYTELNWNSGDMLNYSIEDTTLKLTKDD